jgi:hypothetical protein
MTASTHAYVSCDHHDGSKPKGDPGRWCEARINEGATKAEARKIARRRGWLTGVHSDGTKPSRPSWGHFDFCPLHHPGKPQEAETDA